ncbi:MAG: hypothetical protein ACE5G3_06445 [Gammaproteobacteria bacterium]
MSELVSTPNSALGKLAAAARQKLALIEHIRAGLAPDLAGELLHCGIDDSATLVVGTTTPEWAARFRYENERLLTLARELHPETARVKVRVAIPER